MSKRAQRSQPDDLSRAVTIYVTRDGTLTLDPLFGPAPGGYCGDWRDVAIDLLVEGKIERASNMIFSESRRFHHEPAGAPERPNFSLPVFSVRTQHEARIMIASVAQLQRDPLPFSDGVQLSPFVPHEGGPPVRWYRVRNFEGDFEALQALAVRMRSIYTQWDSPKG